MRQGQQNTGDTSTNFFWFLILLFGVAFLIWWKQKSVIVASVFTIRIYEIFAIQFVVDGINDLLTLLHLPLLNLNNLNDALAFMGTSSWKDVSFDDLMEISDRVGHWLRYPLAGISTILALLMYFKHTGANFRRTYTMDSLKMVEYQNWPEIMPVLKLDLVKEDIDKGAWAMAKLPLDYCKEHNLIRVEPLQNKLSWVIIPGAAQRIFVLQLGPLWRGLNALPIHVQALMVIFLARAHRDRKVADDLLTQIAASSGSGKLNFSGVREQLRKYQNSRILAWVIPRHAYVGTMMATLLTIARSDGVLATSEFLWLKPLDRRMWYILNSVGRQTVMIEVAGLYAHWLAEKKLGCALRVPMVKEAVNGLDSDVKDILYVAEGETWQSFNNAA